MRRVVAPRRRASVAPLFVSAEDGQLAEDKVHDAGEADGQQVAGQHGPARETLDKEQDAQLAEQGADAGEVERQAALEKRAEAVVVDAVVPHEVVVEHVVGEHAALESDDRRDDVGADVAAEDKLGAEPKNPHLDGGPHEATEEEAQIARSDTFQFVSSVGHGGGVEGQFLCGSCRAVSAYGVLCYFFLHRWTWLGRADVETGKVTHLFRHGEIQVDASECS